MPLYKSSFATIYFGESTHCDIFVCYTKKNITWIDEIIAMRVYTQIWTISLQTSVGAAACR